MPFEVHSLSVATLKDIAYIQWAKVDHGLALGHLASIGSLGFSGATTRCSQVKHLGWLITGNSPDQLPYVLRVGGLIPKIHPTAVLEKAWEFSVAQDHRN
jgi:hypothetical protein